VELTPEMLNRISQVQSWIEEVGRGLGQEKYFSDGNCYGLVYSDNVIKLVLRFRRHVSDPIHVWSVNLASDNVPVFEYRHSDGPKVFREGKWIDHVSKLAYPLQVNRQSRENALKEKEEAESRRNFSPIE
jgi:hypothetical protein